MKPRIFISSTFYDLKYIREDLANFVRAYDYEPILFEDGDIGYTPGKNLDKSCYEAMKNSDMVILIIGGEYGSAASGEEKDEFWEYMSVTRNEFRTAIETGIPIFAMIDKKVMTEYGVYEANYDLIEKEKHGMKFSITKNINVFRFIKEVKNIVTLPIQEFEKSADIKGFISKQWADMFKNYLIFLKEKEENQKIKNSVNEMEALIQKMDIMLDSIGKKILLKDNPEEYNSVVNRQKILSFCLIVSRSFHVILKTKERTSEKIDKEIREVVQNKNIRKKIITEFILILRDTHVNKLWDVYYENTMEGIMEIQDIFNKSELFKLSFFHDGYPDLIEDKYRLLFKNINEIIEVMIEDMYFLKLVNISGIAYK